MEDQWAQAMLRGDFETAWRICDAVLKQRRDSGLVCAHWPRHRQFIWDGTPPHGKRVLVRCYHGLGDTLQFARLLRMLRRDAAHVTLWVQPQLIALLQDIPGVDRLLALHEGTASIDYDLDIELMELPHLLRLRLCDLPGTLPYLRVPRRARADGPLRIGLVHRSGAWNPERSIDPALVAPLLNSAPHLRWYSLDYPASRAAPRLASLACEDMRRMACRMTSLDLIITVDTMQAHLAGTLGVRTWLLLPKASDWRWMLDRSDSPWYPTMHLFRQARAGCWQPVLEEMQHALQTLIRARDTRSTGCRAFSD